MRQQHRGEPAKVLRLMLLQPQNLAKMLNQQQVAQAAYHLAWKILLQFLPRPLVSRAQELSPSLGR